MGLNIVDIYVLYSTFTNIGVTLCLRFLTFSKYFFYICGARKSAEPEKPTLESINEWIGQPAGLEDKIAVWFFPRCRLAAGTWHRRSRDHPIRSPRISYPRTEQELETWPFEACFFFCGHVTPPVTWPLDLWMSYPGSGSDDRLVMCGRLKCIRKRIGRSSIFITLMR